ncbi:hypothetical protein FKO01_15160 [Mesorhizobium sp. B2-3-3]|nr:hypothetical protein FKO01_15160 [Mesorhizobium sp. B2-3-3]
MFDVVLPVAVLLSISLPAASLQRSDIPLEFVPSEFVVELVALVSVLVLPVPVPVPLPAVVPPDPVFVPVPLPVPLDCAMAEVARTMANTDAERSLIIGVSPTLIARLRHPPTLIYRGCSGQSWDRHRARYSAGRLRTIKASCLQGLLSSSYRRSVACLLA